MDSMPLDLSKALAYHRKGDLDRASQLYRSAIEADPSRDVAYHLLGMVAIQAGDPTHAVTLIGRAITLRPNVAEYHGGIAEAYWALGKLEEAIASGREALRLNPESWQVRCNLGSTLVHQGQLDEAIELFREAIRLQPNFAQAYNNLGHALQIRGDSAGAVEHFRTALRLNPALVEVHGNLGKILLDRGETNDALKHCQEAIRLRPNSADAHHKLGNVLQTLGQLVEAESCFRRSIQLSPMVAAGYACLGAIQEHIGDTEQSLVSYREALRLDPRHAGVLAKLATRFKDRLPADDQAAIEGLLASPGLVTDQRLPLLFGLAHVFDARGEFDRAAELTIQANAGQQAEFEANGLGYNATTRANDVQQIMEAFTPDFFERVKEWGLPTERPVFVVGMPRSGTSLVEQILASHSQVFGAGELRLAAHHFKAMVDGSGPVRSLRDCLDRLDRPRLERLARTYLDGLEAFNRSSDRIIDKMPENTLFLGLMAALFPNARVIHCRRNARDTALSCWMTHFGQLRWSCVPDFIAARILESARIMDHWRNVLPIPIFDIDYEDLVDNLEARSRSLIAACGLDWELACLDFHKTRRHVRTASVRQVRQPIYRNSIGRWTNYERSLAFLFEKLPPEASTSDSRNHGL
jgi:tetratricopeptide (TPR) repeat protein